MIKLDMERPYGRIVGCYERCFGAVYTQDGKFFDARKILIEPKDTDHEKADEEQEKNAKAGNDGNGQGQGQEKADEQKGLLTSASESEPIPELVMNLTDKQLEEMAEEGMAILREYADKFGVKGRAKTEIIEELKAFRK